VDPVRRTTLRSHFSDGAKSSERRGYKGRPVTADVVGDLRLQVRHHSVEHVAAGDILCRLRVQLGSRESRFAQRSDKTRNGGAAAKMRIGQMRAKGRPSHRAADLCRGRAPKHDIS